MVETHLFYGKNDCVTKGLSEFSEVLRIVNRAYSIEILKDRFRP